MLAPGMKGIPSIAFVAVWFLIAPRMLAQQSAAALPKVLAFFTSGGEIDHFFFAQQAMRALGANASAGG